MTQAGATSSEQVDKLCQDKVHSSSKALKIGNLPQSICNEFDAIEVNVKRVRIICNPYSGAKKGLKVAKKAVNKFLKHGLIVDQMFTERSGHAEEICRNMKLDGIDVLAIIGGDGTIHECINGIMQREDQEEVKKLNLAFIPGGTGNSFVLELQNSFSSRKAIKRVIRGMVVPIDLLELKFPYAKADQKSKVYSFNGLHWGMASRVSHVAEKYRWMGSASRYTTAVILEVFKGEKIKAKVTFETKDGNQVQYTDEFSLIICNNIVTAAKGMKLAPSAKINDGYMDLLISRSSSMIDLYSCFRKMYDGTHILLPFVEYHQVKNLSIVPVDICGESNSIPNNYRGYLDVDGELQGITPFNSNVLPSAIRVIV